MIIFTLETVPFQFYQEQVLFCLNTEKDLVSPHMPGMHYTLEHWAANLVPFPHRHSGCYSPPALSRRRDLHAAPHPSGRWWHLPSCILLRNSRDFLFILDPRTPPPPQRPLTYPVPPEHPTETSRLLCTPRTLPQRPSYLSCTPRAPLHIPEILSLFKFSHWNWTLWESLVLYWGVGQL